MKATGADISWLVVLSPLVVAPALIVLLFLVGLSAAAVKWTLSNRKK